MNKTDDALLKVWEMKDSLTNDFKNSNFDNFIDFIENEMIEIRQKYHIYYNQVGKEKQTTAA
ncbi:MAG: hypothetical protein NT007_15040 [Candidatus Kapabacteria bacterium]|nr:hypothetical protein [Candidatus Kapabacteria bacterium]